MGECQHWVTMKSQNKIKTHNTPKSSKGMGDFYGVGVKNPVGKVRRDYIYKEISEKDVKEPPRALA